MSIIGKKYARLFKHVANILLKTSALPILNLYFDQHLHRDFAGENLLTLGFEPTTFRPTSSSLQPHLPYRFLGLLLVTQHGQALTVSQYFGGPSSSCYSHYFGCQQSNPRPEHLLRVAIHLLD